MTQILLKKFIAAILPFCFLWLFATCVLTCADESAETYQHYSTLSKTAEASDSDSCSIVNTPSAIVSERAAFDFQISPVILSSVFPVNSSNFVPAKISRRNGKPPFREPPLKLLSVLRI